MEALPGSSGAQRRECWLPWVSPLLRQGCRLPRSALPREPQVGRVLLRSVLASFVFPPCLIVLRNREPNARTSCCPHPLSAGDRWLPALESFRKARGTTRRHTEWALHAVHPMSGVAVRGCPRRVSP